jgi:hypothetical protein
MAQLLQSAQALADITPRPQAVLDFELTVFLNLDDATMSIIGALLRHLLDEKGYWGHRSCPPKAAS